MDVLKRNVGKRTEGFVFLSNTGDRYKSIHATFTRHVKNLRLEVDGTKLRIHDLRHVFATWLLKKGVSLDSLRVLMGHSERGTTDR